MSQVLESVDLRERVAQVLSENPSAPLHGLAQRLGVAELDVVRALPRKIAVEAPLEEFDFVWEALLSWSRVTVVAQNDGFVMEYQGCLPRGRHRHGMFNLHEEGVSLGGHVLSSQLAGIWFVSKPHFGHESHGVLFYAASGRPAFGVYVGRNEKRELIPRALKGYQALRARYEGA